MADVNTTTTDTTTQAQGGDTSTTTTKGAEDTTTKGTDTSKTEPKAKTEEEIREELRKEYEKIADKRVTDAQKKWEKAAKEKAAKEKMSEEERKAAEERERQEAQAKKDLELTIKGLRLDVVDAVAELGLDAGFRKLIAVEDLANITDEEERKEKLTERVKGIKALFDEAVAKEVEKAKAEFLKGTTPATGSGKKSEEDKYSQYKKAGNVKGMIGEKLNKLHSGSDDE